MHERDIQKKNRPFGRWPSAITADNVIASAPRRAEPCIVGDRLFWLQSVPEEKGRTTIMCKPLNAPPSAATSILPRPLSARSKVHEYGGGSYLIADGSLFFVLADDQQIYQVALDTLPHAFDPVALTDDPSARFADLIYDPLRQCLLAVREQHLGGQREPENTVVSIAINNDNRIDVIAQGDNFYANPTLSPCGKHLVWLCWNHPDMPWDNSQLWLCSRTAAGTFHKSDSHPVAGNGNESLFLPRFHPTGDLYFVSDRSNWWNLYRIAANTLASTLPNAEELLADTAEYATPQWVFRMSTYHFLDEHTLLACATRDGRWSLSKIHLNSLTASPLADPDTGDLTSLSDIAADGAGNGVFIGAAPDRAPTLFALKSTAASHWLAQTESPALAAKADIAQPQPCRFATANGEHAYGFYYPPTHQSITCTDQKPPLIVICHGGPTGATDTALNPKIQYWTNRGFAIMDVNYRGSTGYGRDYRHSLHNNWGVHDVADVCAAARYAVQQGWADENKLIIKGGSAGGYTVLAALAFTRTFNAGVSLYGIGDLETLARDTHKFEARYLDKLVGSYPEQQALFQQRSPIHFVDNITCPLLVFQGLEDKVVPPNQAEAMVDAVRRKGLYVDYVTFADEGHGFRNADNIAVMLAKELDFYQKVFQL